MKRTLWMLGFFLVLSLSTKAVANGYYGYPSGGFAYPSSGYSLNLNLNIRYNTPSYQPYSTCGGYGGCTGGYGYNPYGQYGYGYSGFNYGGYGMGGGSHGYGGMSGYNPYYGGGYGYGGYPYGYGMRRACGGYGWNRGSCYRRRRYRSFSLGIAFGGFRLGINSVRF